MLGNYFFVRDLLVLPAFVVQKSINKLLFLVKKGYMTLLA